MCTVCKSKAAAAKNTSVIIENKTEACLESFLSKISGSIKEVYCV